MSFDGVVIRYGVLLYRVVYRALSCYGLSFVDLPCNMMLQYAVAWYGMFRYNMLCRARSWYDLA
eukprot:2188715-Pyramimonas_sp.AAC.1